MLQEKYDSKLMEISDSGQVVLRCWAAKMLHNICIGYGFEMGYVVGWSVMWWEYT